MTARIDHIRPGSMVTGPTLPERIEVLATVPIGAALKVIGRGVASGLTYDPVLGAAKIAHPRLHTVQDPARLGWQPVMSVEHYRADPAMIRSAAALSDTDDQN